MVTADAGNGLPPGPGGQTGASADAGGSGAIDSSVGALGTTGGTGGIDASHPDASPAVPGGGGDATVAEGGVATDAGSDGAAADAGDAGHAGDAGDAGASDGAIVSTGDPEFDMCYAKLTPNCNAKDQNTAALIQAANCKSLTNIPLPLTDGTTYGPKTLTGGPYGGKVEWNQGVGTEYANAEFILEGICVPVGIDTFGEPESVTAEIKNLRDVDYTGYTIFRPSCFKKGEKYPVITWANGTCGEIAGYSPLLSIVASYGFVIIASNSTWTATDNVQLRALDYAKALNEDSKSIFYQKLDMEHIGAMGHSQGAAATATSGSDPRIDAIIFFNTGTSNDKPFLDVSGEHDVSATTPQSMTDDVNAATKPGAWIYFHKIPETGGSSTGHLTLMEQPERVLDFTVAWWKWQLKGDQEAKKMFVGSDCGLCKSPSDYEYGHNSLLQ